MSTKDCKGCGENFDISNKEGRTGYSSHIKECISYQNMKAEELALRNKDSEQVKDDSFLNMLEGFTMEQQDSLLKAVKFFVESHYGN